MNEVQQLKARIVQLSTVLIQQAQVNHMAHHEAGMPFQDCQRPACVNARNVVSDEYTAAPQRLSPEPATGKPAVIMLTEPELKPYRMQAGLFTYDTMGEAKASVDFWRKEKGLALAWPVTLLGDGHD